MVEPTEGIFDEVSMALRIRWKLHLQRDQMWNGDLNSFYELDGITVQ